jgi:hypothetical protein
VASKFARNMKGIFVELASAGGKGAYKANLHWVNRL